MTTIQNEFIYAALYLLIVGLAITAETVTIGRLWKPNEWARWVVGVATVMLPALAFTILDISPMSMWLVIMGGFLLAGAIRGVRGVHDDTTEQAAEMSAAVTELERANRE